MDLFLIGLIVAVPFYAVQLVVLLAIAALSAARARGRRPFQRALIFLAMRLGAHLGFSALIGFFWTMGWISETQLMTLGWERSELVVLFLLFDLVSAPILLAASSALEAPFAKRAWLAASAAIAGTTTFGLLALSYWRALQ